MMSMSGCAFRSFFLAGFECSTQKLRNGTRRDLIAATRHDRFCEADYVRLREVGIAAARDGVRWHLIEREPWRYDFSSLLPMLQAARKTGMQIIWDVFHYGWPDDLDLFSAEFIERFEKFAQETACFIASETEGAPYFSVTNELSFFSWAAGDYGILNPFVCGRGDELKAHLVRATLIAIEAIRAVAPRARFVQVDPIINVVTGGQTTQVERQAAAAHNRAQFDAWDMLAGKLRPELGGAREYLDIVGANYYVHNQWVLGGEFIERSDRRYRPLHEMLSDLYRRYQRPIFIAETGIEDERRASWLRYICDEVEEALYRGVPVEGICLYPILNYPGWDDERRCHTGLWDYCDENGCREMHRPFAEELARQQVRMERARARAELPAAASEHYCLQER
jgi:beta-glucosidase/6-phospho-beta-glucosidase/beta-galactosidase